MPKENNNPSNIKQIMTHITNKEPSQMKNLVNKEIANRAMNIIQTMRSDIGNRMFGR